MGEGAEVLGVLFNKKAHPQDGCACIGLFCQMNRSLLSVGHVCGMAIRT